MDHPRYVERFANSFYDSRHLDAAPFGSDVGADMLQDVEHDDGVLPASATIASLLPWGDVPSHLKGAESGDREGLHLIYAAGFLLLRFTGTISPGDLVVLRSALLRLAEASGMEEIHAVVLKDLDAFAREQRGH